MMTMKNELPQMSPTAAALYAAYQDSCREAAEFEYCMKSGRHFSQRERLRLDACLEYWDTWLDALYEAFRAAERAA